MGDLLNNQTLWEKIYKIYHHNGEYRFFQAKSIGQMFQGNLVYYDLLDESGGINLQIKLEQFWGNSEEEIHNHCYRWISDHLGPIIAFELIESQ